MTIVTDPQALLAEQAAEVVGKLTNPQASMMMRLPIALSTADWRVFPALKRKGLLETAMGLGSLWLVATELGLACRAILIERQGK